MQKIMWSNEHCVGEESSQLQIKKETTNQKFMKVFNPISTESNVDDFYISGISLGWKWSAIITCVVSII